MKLATTRCVLAVADLQDSLAFYRDALGMELEFEAPGWACLSRDSFCVMLGECPDATPAGMIGDHAYFAYVIVEAIDDFHAGVVSHGVSVTKPLTDEPWGMREFSVRTPDGHRIMFGQELD